MNDARRKALRNIIEKLDDLMSDLECLKEEEEDYKDSMPENLQNPERYEKADEAISNLEEACDSLQSAIDYIDEATV